MSIDNYVSQLESVLEEILNYFDYDPTTGYTVEDAEGNLIEIPEELVVQVEKGNDLIFGTHEPIDDEEPEEF